MSLNKEVIATYARGEARTLMAFISQGILSPASPPNRQRQRGGSNAFGCMEAHPHPKASYHFGYHVPHVLDRTPAHLLYLVRGWL